MSQKCINCVNWVDETNDCTYILTCLANNWEPDPAAYDAAEYINKNNNCPEFEWKPGE